MTDHEPAAPDNCDKQILDQRLRDAEQRLDGHDLRLTTVEGMVSAYAERIKSVDDRVTVLVQESSGQKHKLEQIEKTNSQENARIYDKVTLVNDTLTDHMQNSSDISRRLRVVETGVSTLGTDFETYKSKNAELLETVETAVTVLDRVESIIKSLLGELKKLIVSYLLRGLVALAIAWAIYRFFPGAKPLLQMILTGGLPG